jgi:hypothetical protein
VTIETLGHFWDILQATSKCNTAAEIWTCCVVTTMLGEGDVARVSVHVATCSVGSWALSNLIIARVGASLNLLG